MKTLYTWILVCTMFLSGAAIAQSETDLPELLDRLNQNHMGSISDVFNQDELLILRNHFGQNNQDAQPIRSIGANIFGTENQSSVFGTIHETNPGTFNMISNSTVPDFEGAGVYDPFDDVFYVIDDANNVWVLDPVTGIYASLGMITPPTGETFTGLEFDPATGDLYGISTDGMGTSTLSIINMTTLAVTPVGLTGMVLAIALAASNNGTLYAVDIDDDNLYSLNKTTGLGTVVGNIGFNANFGAGMFRLSSSGAIYLTAYNPVVNDSQLWLLNIATGLATLIGIILVGTLAQMAWGAFQLPLLGTTDLNQDNLGIYPNPANDILNLKANSPIENIEIYSITGQKLLTRSIGAARSEVDVSHLQTGNYILKAITGSQSEVHKFIKQ